MIVSNDLRDAHASRRRAPAARAGEETKGPTSRRHALAEERGPTRGATAAQGPTVSDDTASSRATQSPARLRWPGPPAPRYLNWPSPAPSIGVGGVLRAVRARPKVTDPRRPAPRHISSKKASAVLVITFGCMTMCHIIQCFPSSPCHQRSSSWCRELCGASCAGSSSQQYRR